MNNIHVHTIKLNNHEETKLNMIIEWLQDMPFKEARKITKTEAIKTCIEYFHQNCFEEKI